MSFRSCYQGEQLASSQGNLKTESNVQKLLLSSFVHTLFGGEINLEIECVHVCVYSSHEKLEIQVFVLHAMCQRCSDLI